MTATLPPAESPAADTGDPSMEEILASIRRILNEDEPTAVGQEPRMHTAPDDDVLVLDKSMLVSPPDPDPEDLVAEAPPAAEPPPAQPSPGAMAPSAQRAPDPPVTAELRPLPAVATPDPGSDLVAPEAAAAAASAVGSLMRTLAAGRATQVWSGGPTLEDMVRAELRVLLKEWLDSNLPPLVERLVRTEIERVVNRAVP
jgi:cell pole-organizing protein PopZ